MLERWIEDPLALGAAQAAAAITLALLVIRVARVRAVRVGRETLVALGRGLVQIVAVGSVLLLLLRGPGWTAGLVLLGMMAAAAGIASRRAGGLEGAWSSALLGIVLGSGLVIATMTAAGVIDTVITALIPVGSMIIANAMNTTALALERYRAELESHAPLVETGLALGAAPEAVAEPFVQSAVFASLIPRLDSLRSLGIVWIPGLMTGMLLAGADPIYAALYQFVVIAMIFAASALASVASVVAIRGRAFTAAEQLRVG